jgi:flavin reductase (DIM6/NTAB) family NADH-FMN oxidoreductase RutF
MTDDARTLPGDDLRRAMRRWVTGVSIVTSHQDGVNHGMTVNSFVSVSLEPPLVVITLAKNTRTHAQIEQSMRFGVTMLNVEQQHLAEIFAGRVADAGDRFSGVETFSLGSPVRLIQGGMAGLDCRVVHTYDLPQSTLFFGQVEAVYVGEGGEPLIYFNRDFHRMQG